VRPGVADVPPSDRGWLGEQLGDGHQ
jgi:hypothetical protein